MKNNFTNKINELQDFNLEPNKEVWVEIEKQLPQEKKRRIVAWWWGLPIVLGLGLTTWLLSNNNKKEDFLSKKEDKISVLSQKIEKNQEDNKVVIVKNTPIFVKNSSIIDKNTYVSAKKTPTLVKNSSIFDENTHLSAINTSTFVKNSSILDENTHISAKKTPTLDKNNSILNENTHISDKDIPTLGESNETNIIDSLNRKTTKIISRLNYPKKLHWSLTFGGGVSYLSRNGLLSSTQEQIYTSNVSAGSVPPQQNNNLSLPNSGFNFNVGVNGDYILSKKSTLQFGLHYKYLQNNIALELVPQTTMFLLDDLYRNGDYLIYKNNYHFISIPVSYKYCLNPSAKNKISFIVGGSMDYAIAKNWLYINNEQSYYEKNNNELNNFFTSLHTGLSFNINNKLSVDIVAKKYLNTVQKSSSKYYWQQLDMQLNIPLKLKK